MICKKSFVILLCFFGILSAGQATTQGARGPTLPPDAQAAVDKGILAAKVPDYLLAIRYFQDARKLAPEAPEIFFDLGVAESKLPGRELRAIAWYGAYLTANPNAANAADVKNEMLRLSARNQTTVALVISTLQDKAAQTASYSTNLGSVAELWATVGDAAASRKTVDLIADRNGKINALIAVAKIQATAGDPTGAKDTLASARKIADLLEDDHFDRSFAYRSVGQAQASVGDIADAQKTAVLIQRADCKFEVEIAIAQAQIQARDIAGANQTLGAAENTSDSVGVPGYKVMVAEAKIQTGDAEGARKTLASTRKLVDSLPNNSSDEAYGKSGGLAKIFYLQAEAGDIAGARQTLTAALKSIEFIKDEYDKKVREDYLTKDQMGTLHGLVSKRIEANDIGGALSIADLIYDPDKRCYSQENIAEAQAKAGDFASAKKTASSIHLDIAYCSKGSARLLIVEAQLKAGDIAGAQETAALIEAPVARRSAESDIAEAQAKASEAPAQAGLTNRSNPTAGLIVVAQSQPILSAPAQPAAPVLKLSDWLAKVDSTNAREDCPLNTDPFLDLTDYLKSLPPSNNPQAVFDGLEKTAWKLVTAQNVIGGMARRQGLSRTQ